MYVETVPNRGSRPTVLLREGWREGRKVRKRTIANLSDWPQAKVEVKKRGAPPTSSPHHTAPRCAWKTGSVQRIL